MWFQFKQTKISGSNTILKWQFPWTFAEATCTKTLILLYPSESQVHILLLRYFKKVARPSIQKMPETVTSLNKKANQITPFKNLLQQTEIAKIQLVGTATNHHTVKSDWWKDIVNGRTKSQETSEQLKYSTHQIKNHKGTPPQWQQAHECLCRGKRKVHHSPRRAHTTWPYQCG